MAKTILKVIGMSCEHCVKAITRAACALAGVLDVAVDLEAKTVTVEHDPALTPEKIKAEIEDQGYDVIS